MRLTEYLDFINNGRKNVKRYTHFSPYENYVKPKKSKVFKKKSQNEKN